MAAGDPVLINLPNATFLQQPETGAIIETTQRKVESKVKEIFNAAVCYTVGLIFYDFMASLSWSAIVNGTTGLPAAAPGVALVLANNAALTAGSTGNGVLATGTGAGGLYSKDITFDHPAEELLKVSGNAMQRGGVA